MFQSHKLKSSIFPQVLLKENNYWTHLTGDWVQTNVIFWFSGFYPIMNVMWVAIHHHSLPLTRSSQLLQQERGLHPLPRNTGAGPLDLSVSSCSELTYKRRKNNLDASGGKQWRGAWTRDRQVGSWTLWFRPQNLEGWDVRSLVAGLWHCGTFRRWNRVEGSQVYPFPNIRRQGEPSGHVILQPHGSWMRAKWPSYQVLLPRWLLSGQDNL